MNRNKNLTLAASVLIAGTFASGSAMAVQIFDYGFNIDGAVSLPSLGDPVPGAVDLSGFDTITGLGNIGVSIGGAGAHSFDAFFDHDIDAAINTFFNEEGFVNGAPAPGQSWEIDEPGFINGDIFDNFQTSSLDNMIGVSVFGNTSFPDDVSMAMGWDFSLAAGETAEISLALTQNAPGGFYLQHLDPDSQESVYLSGNLRIAGDPGQVPEPGVLWLLMGSGLAGWMVSRRRRSA